MTAYIPNKKESRPVCFAEKCKKFEKRNPETGEFFKVLDRGWFVNIHKGNWQKISGSALAKEHGEEFCPENIQVLGLLDFQVKEIFKEAFSS